MNFEKENTDRKTYVSDEKIKNFLNSPLPGGLFLLVFPKKALFLQGNNLGMAITSDRLRQTFSEGGAQEIYQAIKSSGDFLGFAKQ